MKGWIMKNYETRKTMIYNSTFYNIDFEVTGNPFYLIGSHRLIYSRNAAFFALNRFFFSASENALLKYYHQSDFKACLK